MRLLGSRNTDHYFAVEKRMKRYLREGPVPPPLREVFLAHGHSLSDSASVSVSESGKAGGWVISDGCPYYELVWRGRYLLARPIRNTWHQRRRRSMLVRGLITIVAVAVGFGTVVSVFLSTSGFSDGRDFFLIVMLGGLMSYLLIRAVRMLVAVVRDERG